MNSANETAFLVSPEYDTKYYYMAVGILDQAHEFQPRIAMQVFISELVVMEGARLWYGLQLMRAEEQRLKKPKAKTETATCTVRAFFSQRTYLDKSTFKLMRSRGGGSGSGNEQLVAVSWLIAVITELVSRRDKYERANELACVHDLVVKKLKNKKVNHDWSAVAI